MRKCPNCGRVYEDDAQIYCLNDGAALIDPTPPLSPTVNYSGSANTPPFNAPAAKKKNHFWIIGGVAALMMFLFIGVLLIVGLIGVWKKNSNSNATNGNAQPTPVTLTSTADKYQPELKMAISGANTAEATSRATLNANGLEKYYSGEALKSIKTSVEQLKGLKMLQVAVIKSQDYEYFKVNEAGTEAEVRVVETWEVTSFRVPDAKCLSYNPPTRLPQVIYLKKASSGWMIDAVVPDQQVKTNPQPCPKKK
jgi:hypothetical protein